MNILKKVKQIVFLGMIIFLVSCSSNEKVLTSILVTTPPLKTDYVEGQLFDPSGMVVTAVYSDGTLLETTDYTYSPNEALDIDDTKITITLLDKTVDINIDVISKSVLTIEIITPADRTVYNEGEVFDPSGMVVVATYNDGNSVEITDYIFAPSEPLNVEDTYITIIYQEQSSALDIEVNKIITVEPPIVKHTFDLLDTNGYTDQSDNNWNLSGINFLSTQDGYTNQAVAFNGGGYLKTENNFSIQNFSLSIMFKPTAFIGEQSLIAMNEFTLGLRQWELKMLSNGTVQLVAYDHQLRNWDNRITTSLPANLNEWNQVIFILNENQATLYMNNTLIDSVTFNNRDGLSYNSLSIGARNVRSNGEAFFRGSIDNLMIYDQILTPEAVESLFEISSHNVTLNLNNGESNWIIHGYEGQSFIIPNFYNPGYILSGWYEDADFKKAYKGNYIFAGQLELYANWVERMYTIRYENLDDAINPNTVTTYTISSETIVLANPTREGYDFEGWYIVGTQVTEITTGSHGDITIYARWSNPAAQGDAGI